MNIEEGLELTQGVWDLHLFDLAGTPISVATLVIFSLIIVATLLTSHLAQKAVVRFFRFRGVTQEGTLGVASKLMPPASVLPRAPKIAERTTGKTMGQSGEIMARRNEISREAQDAFAVKLTLLVPGLVDPLDHMVSHVAKEEGGDGPPHMRDASLVGGIIFLPRCQGRRGLLAQPVGE